MIIPSNKTADDVTNFLIRYIMDQLEDILIDDASEPKDDYRCGRKEALAECLEILQSWQKAEECGLDFDIELEYNI